MQFLKKFDQMIFKKLDQLQEHPEFQKITESYSGMEERLQEVVKAVLAATVLIIPLVFILTVRMSNSSLKEQLMVKEEIIHMAHEYIQENALIRTAENKVLGRDVVTDQGQFQTKITQLINASGANANNMQVNNFETTDLKGNIIEARLNLKFSSLSNDHLFTIVHSLVNREKIKIESLNINLNQATNLLDGVMTLLYYSKEVMNDE